MFIDLVTLKVVGGRGGNGIVAFRRELKVEFGGPSGGSGGKGGDIIFVGDEGLSTLLDLRYNRVIKGENGEHGQNKGMLGANAKHTYIRVPLGTSIYDEETNIVIADIIKHNQEVVIAKGGRGGRGNIAFATPTNKAPSICEKGEPGIEKSIRVELRVLADVGLVGFPSVGKSTLISSVSKARPKIAEYHFTTLVPNLGMVLVKDGRSFVMADLPGIIEGASQGAGLGLQFLRHIERCRVIVHVIDMAGTELRNPYEDFLAINKELKQYQYHLLERPQIIVANKMDEEQAKINLEKFKKQLKEDIPIIPISALLRENLDELLYKIADILEKTKEFKILDESLIDKVIEYNFQKEEPWFEIEKTSTDSFYVSGKRLRRLFEMTDFNREECVIRFTRQLRSFGLDEQLRKLGAKTGDTIRVFEFEFELFD